MPVLLLPDLVAILFLTLVLALLRRRFAHESAGLWMAGLLLIVLECAARVLYLMQLPPLWHHVMHVVALDAYCLAGVVFLGSAMPEMRRMPHAGLYLALNASPHLLLMTLYGMDFKTEIVYRVLAVNGLTVGLLSAAVLRRGWRHLLVFCVIWSPMIAATTQANFRTAIYLSLFSLYLLTAVAFSVNLPRGSKGRLLIAGGFVCWSLCFVTHPWVAGWGKVWVQLSSEVWDMQKFLITLGFVLLLFECQVWNAEWLALHDQLTGLPNRRLYEDRHEHALARAQRNGSALLLFNLDLDGFKTINDTFGHDAGDAVLRGLSRNLQTCVRRSDTLGRVGGDEFRLLAVDLVRDDAEDPGQETGRLQQQAMRIAEHIRRAVEVPVEVDSEHGRQKVQVSTSIGVAFYPADGTSATELCRIADRRMYEDKQERRQQVEQVAAELLLAVEA